MNLHLKALGAVAFLLAGTIGGSAHGAWVAERWGQLGVIYGHGAGDDPYDPAKVTTVVAVDEDGAPVAVTVERKDKHAILVPASEPAAIALEFDNGFWTEGADGKWVNKPKDEVMGAKASGHYVKNSLALVHAHGDLPAFPKQALQIVPLTNPIGGKAGDILRVKVLFEGKPLAGVKVTLDYVNAPALVSAESDANGEVDAVLRNDGLNILAVQHSVTLTGDPKADEIGYTATLSFVAAEHVDE